MDNHGKETCTSTIVCGLLDMEVLKNNYVITILRTHCNNSLLDLVLAESNMVLCMINCCFFTILIVSRVQQACSIVARTWYKTEIGKILEEEKRSMSTRSTEDFLDV